MIWPVPQGLSRAAVLVESVVFNNLAAVFPNVLAVLPKLHIYGDPMAAMSPVYSVYVKV